MGKSKQKIKLRLTKPRPDKEKPADTFTPTLFFHLDIFRRHKSRNSKSTVTDFYHNLYFFELQTIVGIGVVADDGDISRWPLHDSKN